MPKKPPSDRTRAKGVSTYITPRFHRRSTPPTPDQSPTTQICETNPIKTTPDAIGPPLYLTPTEVGDMPTAKNAKRTQFTPTTALPMANRQKPKAAFHETNPIYPYRHIFVERKKYLPDNTANYSELIPVRIKKYALMRG